MSVLTHLPATATAEEIAAVIHRDGAVVVDDLVETTLLDQVSAEIQPYVDATPTGGNEFAGVVTSRTGGLAGRSAGARELIMNPLVLSVGKLVLADTKAMQLMNTEIISIGATETVQPLHRDQDAWPYPFPPGYEPEFSVMWPLNTDFTLDNGATRLVPGSHRTGARNTFEENEILQAEMTRGSVLIWTGSVYHGGGANRSGLVRQGVNIAYALGWLRQEENQYLAVPPEIATTLDDDLLRLMGYERPALSLGNAVDRSHPLSVFRPELAHPGETEIDDIGSFPLAEVVVDRTAAAVGGGY
jgi:ectoine hydroxylase-related dioxygenase (phytanoyl-CoA dioxygenase family)